MNADAFQWVLLTNQHVERHKRNCLLQAVVISFCKHCNQWWEFSEQKSLVHFEIECDPVKVILIRFSVRGMVYLILLIQLFVI